jgi:hypothetical protein
MAREGATVTTYDEWRVTGDPGGPYGLYEFVWDPARHENPEAEARGYMALLRDRIAATGSRQWADGPHLHKRTVTVTDWQDAGPPPLNRPHPTCIDVTAIDQTPRSEWICGPECPQEA